MNLGIFSINDTIYFRANTVNSQGSALDATVGPAGPAGPAGPGGGCGR
ncbi:hypothetical protein LCGC14_3026610, partial [marine sediment metagenome]